MSKIELEQLVDKVLEQDRRGTSYRVDASSLSDALFDMLLSDLDNLSADYTVQEPRSVVILAPSDMAKGHEILTLLRHSDLEVDGL